MFAEVTFEGGSTTLAIYTILAALAFIAYFLGRYTAKVDGISKDMEGLRKLVGDIFDKLDELARMLPHTCQQTTVIAQLEREVGINGQRITALEHWQESSKTP